MMQTGTIVNDSDKVIAVINSVDSPSQIKACSMYVRLYIKKLALKRHCLSRQEARDIRYVWARLCDKAASVGCYLKENKYISVRGKW